MANVFYYNHCKRINRLCLSLLTAGHATVDDSWYGRVVNPVYTRLYYVKSGTACIQTTDECLQMEVGQWYLLPAGCTFDYSSEGEMEQLFFHVKLIDFDETDLLRTAGRPLTLRDDHTDCDALITAMDTQDIVSGMTLRQHVERMILMFVERYGIEIHADDYSPCIFNALNYIKQHLSVSLSIAEIADHVFVSKSTLTKRFQKELSMSVNEYITDTIMFEAVKLLMSTDLSILAVSEKFGFSDQFYFSRRFKAKFGKSPREFRKAMYI